MGEGAPTEPFSNEHEEEIQPKLGNPEDPVTAADYQYFRNQWNEAGENLAAKYTQETGTEHSVADALQPIAETFNTIYENENQRRQQQNDNSDSTYPPLREAA